MFSPLVAPGVSIFMLSGAIFGFIAVAAGAFGAHAMRGKVPPERLASFETAVRYLMYHALALLITAFLESRPGSEGVVAFAGLCFILGAAVFSGSLFALALTGRKRWGAVTPLGGALLLIGWAAIAWAALSSSGGPYFALR
jgi:uncharacterized membrane protein YgdD (TMEM256/DUF423 family)